jgi:hypothetical protein
VIEFLVGAFSVLSVRGNKIVEILETKTGIPPAAVERCRRVGHRARGIVNSVKNKEAILLLVRENLKTKKITAAESQTLLKQLLKSYRDLRRDIDVIEENFVGHLVRYNDADLFFTELAAALWNETNLPDIPPIAVTNTSGYFCTWASLGIIFSPPSSEHHLLIFPDLYHEFGHIIHQGVKIKLFGPRFEAELKAHAAELRNQMRRTSRPSMDDNIISDIVSRWINSWAEEVACDTLAAHILGPAYGWCNIHLCLQSSNVYRKGNEHPADAARTKHILRVLRRRGYNDDADKIEILWKQYLNLSQQTTSSHYQDYHPDSLFTAVMEDVEQAIKDNNFGVKGKSPSVDTLNESWQKFLNDAENYNDWEEKAINDIKANFGFAA